MLACSVKKSIKSCNLSNPYALKDFFLVQLVEACPLWQRDTTAFVQGRKFVVMFCHCQYIWSKVPPYPIPNICYSIAISIIWCMFTLTFQETDWLPSSSFDLDFFVTSTTNTVIGESLISIFWERITHVKSIPRKSPSVVPFGRCKSYWFD